MSDAQLARSTHRWRRRGVCSLLLLIPRATTLAVALLACTMVGALLTHFFVMGIGPASVIVIMLLGALVVIGWRGRA